MKTLKESLKEILIEKLDRSSAIKVADHILNYIEDNNSDEFKEWEEFLDILIETQDAELKKEMPD